jgi:hypothetical protein
MPDSTRIQHIKELIKRHLQESGGAQWKATRLQCPDISDATFWRYLAQVREEAAGKTEGFAQPASGSANSPRDEMPLVGMLPSFYQPLQKMRLYETLLADADIMRAQALDHRGRITNWRMFEKSIALRERLVAHQADAADFFQSQEAQQLFFKQIVEAVSDLPIEFAKPVIDRLRKIQFQRGNSSAPAGVTAADGS